MNPPTVPGASNPVAVGPISGGGSVSGSGPATPNTGTPVPSGDPAAVAFNVTTEMVDSQQAAIDSYVVQVTGSKKSVVAHASGDVVKAMGAVLKLTAVRPVYAALANPGTLAQLTDRINTGVALVTALEGLVASVKGTNQASLKAGDALVRAAYLHATKVDMNDGVVQNLMAPAQALFAKRPRATVAGAKVGTAIVEQAKAQAHVNNATALANAAQQRLNAVVQSIVAGASPAAPPAAPSAATPPATPPSSTTTPTR